MNALHLRFLDCTAGVREWRSYNLILATSLFTTCVGVKRGGGRGGVEGGGRKIIWSMFSRVPALCSCAAAWAVCTRIYSSVRVCVRARAANWTIFFLYAVFCHCSEARNWAAEKKATPTRFFLKANPLSSSAHEKQSDVFFPPLCYYFS